MNERLKRKGVYVRKGRLKSVMRAVVLAVTKMWGDFWRRKGGENENIDFVWQENRELHLTEMMVRGLHQEVVSATYSRADMDERVLVVY